MISVENNIIFPPSVFCAPAEGVPLGIGYRLRYRLLGSKTKIMALLGWRRCLTLSSGVWIQYTIVMDGRTPGDSKDRAYA